MTSADAAASPPESLPEEPGQRVRAVVERALDALEIDADVVIEESDESITARVEGDDLGLLIGRHGQTIDALQLLCYRAAFRGTGERKRVTVDAAGYRSLNKSPPPPVMTAEKATQPKRVERLL